MVGWEMLQVDFQVLLILIVGFPSFVDVFGDLYRRLKSDMLGFRKTLTNSGKSNQWFRKC